MRAYRSMIAMLILLVGLPTVVGAEAGPRHLRTLLVVAVDQGPSTGLVVQGVLNAEVDRETGVLRGTLTPGENPSTGLPFTSVRFTEVGATLVPDPHVTVLEVRGRIEHHAVNLIVLNAGGPGKHMFGAGTSEHDSGTGLQHAPGILGGPLAGPEAGDIGDWGTPCCGLR
jgi:hypothetical protein